MAAAQFSDDAFNKFLKAGQGTLIGNWYEERTLRDSSGEGRSVPQRHIPRSGLLTDWTKVPSCGPRKCDDTFDRIYGPKSKVAHVALSKIIGGGEADLFDDQPIPATLQAAGRIAKVGAKGMLELSLRGEAAEADVVAEEMEVDRLANQRFFNTTAGDGYQKPNEAEVERPTHLRKSFTKELLHGPSAARSIALRNSGLEVLSHSHYSMVESVTHARMSMADHKDKRSPGGVGLRNDMKLSAATGVNAFGRNSEFSKPVGDSILGLCKDDELANLFVGLQNTQPARSIGGQAPRSEPFQAVPSLAALKKTIFDQLGQVWGPQGYVVLRQRFFDVSDDEGFIRIEDVVGVLRDQLGLTEEMVSTPALSVYLKNLVTMRKQELHVAALMTSLRPAMLPATKLRVIEAFKALGSVDGSVRLGDWLGHLKDDSVRETVVNAFGASDSAQVAGMPLTEQVFTDLLSDLAPLAADPDSLLPC